MHAKAARRPLAATLVSVLAAGALALGTSGAEADPIGSMEVTPHAGSDTQGMALTTSAACPAPATNIIVGVKGQGFPATGQIVVGNSPISAYAPSPSGGIVVPLTSTMRDYASTAGFDTLTGRYDFTLTCRGAFGSTTYGEFTAPIWFTTDTTYQDSAPSTATTTTLTASPANEVVEGKPVTFTATVAPAAASGTVQFRDNGQALGSPVTVAGGQATLTTGTLSVGTHKLTAAFTPADAAHGASGSAELTYKVKIKPPAVVSAAKVTGTVKVASTVTCEVTFNGASSVAYSWLRDGSTISGATARTRKLTSTDYKHKIACRAKGTNSTGSTTSTSPQAGPVAVGPALKNTAKPSISGTHRAGYKQTARPGSWSPSATSYSYQWLRDGRAISGATRSTYTATRSDRGHKLTVRVKAKRTGYSTGTATSAAVKIG
ncbi:Ig-like domain-containing protein [Streptomyces sp. NPDC006458]|uniref:Ig-like domain-containing protein n=1 Tax=Streptomyces sp. NPDC006458 TaxID=3154302 RepID=UPI0033B95CCC